MASLRGLVRKGLKYDPLTRAVMKAESVVPGSVGAGLAALTAENVSSNPYKEGEASRHDIFAGGTELSKKEENRKIGRTVGTAAALFYGAGAAGASSSTSAAIAAQGASTVTAQMEAQAAETAAREAEALQRQTLERGLAGLRKTSTPQTPTLDEARRRAEQADAMRRRRGRRASILTGPEGVGRTPISQRTLIGT